MVVEATPSTTLVVTQSKLLLELLIISFDTPTHFGCLDQVFD